MKGAPHLQCGGLLLLQQLCPIATSPQLLSPLRPRRSSSPCYRIVQKTLATWPTSQTGGTFSLAALLANQDFYSSEIVVEWYTMKTIFESHKCVLGLPARTMNGHTNNPVDSHISSIDPHELVTGR